MERIIDTIQLTSSMWEKYVECPVSGTVTKGDYMGTNMFRASDEEYVLSTNSKVAYGRGSAPHNVVKVVAKINKETVERYEIVSENETTVDPASVLKAGFWLGSAGALAVSSMSGKTYDAAVYFKDGKKSLIRINGPEVLKLFKEMLFEF